MKTQIIPMKTKIASEEEPSLFVEVNYYRDAIDPKCVGVPNHLCDELKRDWITPDQAEALGHVLIEAARYARTQRREVE